MKQNSALFFSTENDSTNKLMLQSAEMLNTKSKRHIALHGNLSHSYSVSPAIRNHPELPAT